MNVYPEAVDAFLVGDVDVVADTIKAMLVDATYAYSDTHEFLASVPAASRVGTAVTLTGKSVAAGVFIAGDITFVAVPAGDTATGVIVYQDSGVEATSRLLVHFDAKADSVPLAVETNGGDINFGWPLTKIFKL